MDVTREKATARRSFVFARVAATTAGRPLRPEVIACLICWADRAAVFPARVFAQDFRPGLRKKSASFALYNKELRVLSVKR